ncbi:MAG: rhodanese-like domain-containing protein [Angelakisella sp.]
MKKILSLLLVATMICSLMAACGAPAASASSEAPAASAAPAPAPSEPPAAPAAPATDVVAEAANGYFANFPDDKHMIGVPDLFKKIDAGEELIILDVRQPADYEKGHLKGAYNVPLGPTVASSLELIPNDVPLYVNCYTGQTSSQVVALLNMAGKFATNIQGGFNNGISTTEGFAKYVDTTAAVLPTESYPVDEAIKTAVTKYFADMEASAGTFKYFNFPAASLKELVVAESEDYTILSIRKAEDFATGHIANALNIPFGKGMQERFTEIPKDKPVVVYCYSGQTSSQTTAVLRMLGYEAYSLAGGMGKAGGSGWLGVDGPLVK